MIITNLLYDLGVDGGKRCDFDFVCCARGEDRHDDETGGEKNFLHNDFIGARLARPAR
jgi:hypothetical protein